MSLLVSLAELLARPGFDNVDEDQAAALLQDATDLARLEAPCLADLEAPLSDAYGAVRVVIVSMVRRGLSNPHGFQQETLGDHSYSAGTSGVATVYATKREIKILRRACGQLGVGTAQLEGYLPLADDRGGPLAYEDQLLYSL